jgi:hypothetical protein
VGGGPNRILDERRRGRCSCEFQEGGFAKPKVRAFCDTRHHSLPDRQAWFGKAEREIHAPDDGWPLSIDIVGDPNRRGAGSLNKPVHEHLATSLVRGVIFIEPGEKIIRLIDDNDCPACEGADRVGDQKRRYPLAAIGLGAFFARLSAKLDREADASAERLGELALARSRRPVEEKVHAAARRASETPGAPYNPGCEIAEIPEMLEVFPRQRGAGRFAEQEIANPARFKSGQGEKALNNE